MPTALPHYLTEDQLDAFIAAALAEDIGPGDHTSLATLPATLQATAVCIIKSPGVLAGGEVARRVFSKLDADIAFTIHLEDGAAVQAGDRAFEVQGNARAILSGERLVINILQRMSGIATQTAKVVAALSGTPCRVLDTRKTTPLFRPYEKWAVVLGGGVNHRYGLFDAVLVKDNHIDCAGGAGPALVRVRQYLDAQGVPHLPIIIEARNMTEVQAVVDHAHLGVTRILLDNMTPEQLREAVTLIGGRLPTEASGNLTLQNVRATAEAGVDFVSLGGITHSAPVLDISLKVRM